MDAFIRKELTLTQSTGLEDVAPHCQKLLVWLRSCQEEMQSQNRRLRLTQSLIESQLKALLYLFECYDRFGEALADRCDSHGFFASCSTLEDRRQCIRKMCTGIVNTRRGELYAPLLHLMQKPLTEIQPAWAVIRDLDWSEIRQSEALVCGNYVQPEVQQMRRLVKRIARLTTQQDMERALRRAMELIGFQVWIYLFQEPRESSLHLDCHLLRNMICDILVEADSPPASSQFLHCIYEFVLRPANEARFWASLEHGRLAGSLIGFLTAYWKHHLPHLDLEEMEINTNAPAINTILPIDEATFVTHLMISTRSPCRQQFHRQLLTVLPPAVSSQMMQLLSKVAYVYS
ncbi:hypothetical protein KR009_007081 [Drosophila setifemur]|nr:hypothetical protein KR009_007081 [Drosophila setifemur]